MLHALIFLLFVVCQNGGGGSYAMKGRLGVGTPYFTYSSGLCFTIFIIVESLVFISCAILPTEKYKSLQNQFILSQGILFATESFVGSLITSVLPFASLYSLIAFCVVFFISFSEDMFYIVLSILDSFILTYATTLCLRMTSFIYVVIIAAVLYFILLFICKKQFDFLMMIAKGYALGMSVVAMIDVWNVVKITQWAHRANDSITYVIIGMSLYGVIFGISYIISYVSYFKKAALVAFVLKMKGVDVPADAGAGAEEQKE